MSPFEDLPFEVGGVTLCFKFDAAKPAELLRVSFLKVLRSQLDCARSHPQPRGLSGPARLADPSSDLEERWSEDRSV